MTESRIFMKRVITLFGLAYFSCSVLAVEKTVDCENAMNTLEINHCAAIELETTQVELNNILKRALSTMHMMRSWSVQSRWLKTVGRRTCRLIVTLCTPNGVMVQYEGLWRFPARRR